MYMYVHIYIYIYIHIIIMFIIMNIRTCPTRLVAGGVALELTAEDLGEVLS